MVTTPQKSNASSGAESNGLNSKIIYNRYLHLLRMRRSDAHFSKPLKRDLMVQWRFWVSEWSRKNEYNERSP